jgi:hypothetical protein
MFRVSSWSWAQVLSVASPCLGVVTVVSSERSVVAWARMGDGVQPLLTPNVPVAAAQSSRAIAGQFDYTTGDLMAHAPYWSQGGGFLVTGEAHSSASIASLVSGARFEQVATAGGWGQASFEVPATTEAQVLYKVVFTVDRPTPFTLGGEYRVSSPEFSDYRLKVSLNGFLNLNVVNHWSVEWWTKQTFGASGVLEPGTTYTLESEAWLRTSDSSTAQTAAGNMSASFVMVVPEPSGVICLAACVPFMRRTRRGGHKNISVGANA